MITPSFVEPELEVRPDFCPSPQGNEDGRLASTDSMGSEPRLLRVGLMGFGRTGRDVAKSLVTDPGMSLEWVVRKSDTLEHRSVPEFLGIRSSEPGVIYSAPLVSARELLSSCPVDVIIDFSSESGIDYYGEEASARGIAIVTAISRYTDGRQRQLARLARNTRVLWSPNITLGINFMLLAAQTLQRIVPGVDIQIVEEHFRDKPEVSGTALRLAQALDMSDDAVHVIRAGGIIGVHEVLFGFPAQTVRLRHEAISREAFGNGAIFAARNIVDRENGLYQMEDLLLPYFAGQGNAAHRNGRRRRGALRRLASWWRSSGVELA